MLGADRGDAPVVDQHVGDGVELRRRVDDAAAADDDALAHSDPLAARARAASCARDEPEHGHAHGDAVRHLLLDVRLQAVRDFVADLDAFVHRAGMHDERAGLRAGEAVGVHLVEARVLARARHEAAVHALVLHAQRHHDVRALDRAVEVRLDAHRRQAAFRRVAEAARQQRRRRAEHDVRAERRQRPHVRARDAAVQDVADDDDLLAAHVAERAAHGVEVEQRLRRVRVQAVAGVDDAAVGVRATRGTARRSGCGA